MTKRELAIQYFPQWKLRREQGKAVHKLGRWIAANRELTTRLKATSYHPKQQHFTPAQVELIIEYLGEP